MGAKRVPTKAGRSRTLPTLRVGGVRTGGRSARVVEDVIDATLRELSRVVYEALRVEDVARIAEVNKTTVYRRWPTKLDLVREALASMCLGALPTQRKGPFRSVLVGLLEEFVENVRRPVGRGLARVMVAELGHPEFGRVARSIRNDFEDAWLSVLRQGVRIGEISSSVAPELVLEVLLGTLVGRIHKGEGSVDRRSIEALVALVLDGARVLRRKITGRGAQVSTRHTKAAALAAWPKRATSRARS